MAKPRRQQAHTARARPKTPEERRAASIERLRHHAVPFDPDQPVIEGEDGAGERTQDELRGQILAVTLAWMRSQFAARALSHPEFLKRLAPLREMAETWLSDTQRGFIDDPQPPEEEVDNAAWSVEALNALLWAAGLVKELRWPSKRCDAGALEPLVERVLEGAPMKPRNVGELLDEADLHYRLLWAAVRGKLGEAADASVVYERARSLGWLTQPGSVEWDEVDLLT
jgi:hypothetical protein